MPDSLRVLLRPVLCAVLVAAAAACASGPIPGGAAPNADGELSQGTPVTPASAPDSALIARLSAASAPGAPLQITFDWSLQDRDVRVQGRGVVRVQGPYHARLDLFGPQDVEFVRAVLIDDRLEYRAAVTNVPLPPVPFLWSLLGVFRAPAAPLSAMTGDQAMFTLRYRAAGEEWMFRADSTSLRWAEWQGSDGGRRTVELSGAFRSGRPERAVFRDWREFRELTLNVTTMETVARFDSDTWDVSVR